MEHIELKLDKEITELTLGGMTIVTNSKAQCTLFD